MLSHGMKFLSRLISRLQVFALPFYKLRTERTEKDQVGVDNKLVPIDVLKENVVIKESQPYSACRGVHTYSMLKLKLKR